MTSKPDNERARLAVALISGLVFALGLGLAGMTNPAKVIGFLDVAGDWDPSLGVVMAAAIAVYFPVSRAMRGKRAPRFDVQFHLPTLTDVDRRLVLGAAVFGVGWGLAGYCPGPAIVAATTATVPALVLIAAMVTGMLGQHLLIQRGVANLLLRKN